MKKTLFPIACALFCAALASAQPVLNNGEKYAIGQSGRFVRTVPAAIQPGASGASALWDFSQIPGADSFDIRIDDPANYPAVTDFADSDVVVNFGGSQFFFEKIGATANQVVGFIDPGAGLSVAYPNPWQRALRPLAFGQSATDTLTRSYINTGLVFKGSGVCTVSADAYGVLKLPNGTHENVVRVKIDQLNFDTANIGAVVRVHYQSYAWYTADGVFPLLRIDTQSVTSPFFNNFSKSAYFRAGGTSGTGDVHRVDSHFKAFNAGGRLALLGDFDPAAAYQVELFEAASGIKLGSDQIKPGGFAAIAATDIPLPQSPTAVYVVRVTSGNQSRSIKAVF